MATERCVVVFPDFAGIELVEKFRTLYDPIAAEIAAHITLLFPFESTDDSSDLHLHVQRIVRGMRPFAVELGGVSRQKDGYLFLNVIKGNAELISLHEQLYSGNFDRFRAAEKRFVPHVTIGRFPDVAALQLGAVAATHLAGPFHTVIDALTIVRVHSPDPDEIEHVVSLGL